MFIRVIRKDQGLHFTVVDILQHSEDQTLDLILDLGIIQHQHLNSEQAWYIVAENLIESALTESEKRLLARDLANWLPPLSRQGLRENRQDEIRQLSALCPDDSLISPAIPLELTENDPLIVIADWLEDT
jgi:hypothetical protein